MESSGQTLFGNRRIGEGKPGDSRPSLLPWRQSSGVKKAAAMRVDCFGHFISLPFTSTLNQLIQAEWKLCAGRQKQRSSGSRKH